MPISRVCILFIINRVNLIVNRCQNMRKIPDYRKIYESHYGPIPKDENGSSFDIHHIDGNHTNFDISNLIALSIKEHYDIHYSQGDYAACMLISSRMEITAEERSILASMANRCRVENGTHHFLSGEIQREASLKEVKDGTHRMLGGRIQRQRVSDGTHNFLGGELQRQRVSDGTHHFLIRITCPHCSLVGSKHLMLRWHFDKCKHKSS